MQVETIDDVILVNSSPIELPASHANTEQLLFQLAQDFHKRIKDPAIINNRSVEKYNGYNSDEASFLMGFKNFEALRPALARNDVVALTHKKSSHFPGYEIVRYAIRSFVQQPIPRERFQQIFGVTERYLDHLMNSGVVNKPADFLRGEIINALPLFDAVFPLYGNPKFRELSSAIEAKAIEYRKNRLRIPHPGTRPKERKSSEELRAETKTLLAGTKTIPTEHLRETIGRLIERYKIYVSLNSTGLNERCVEIIDNTGLQHPDSFYVRGRSSSYQGGIPIKMVNSLDANRAVCAMNYLSWSELRKQAIRNKKDEALQKLRVAHMAPLRYKTKEVFAPGTLGIITMEEERIGEVARLASPLIEGIGQFIPLEVALTITGFSQNKFTRRAKNIARIQYKTSYYNTFQFVNAYLSSFQALN